MPAKKRKTSKYIIQHYFVPDQDWEKNLQSAYAILLHWLAEAEAAKNSDQKRRVAAT